MTDHAQALELARIAVEGRLCGNLIERVSIAGESDVRVSSGGSATMRVAWRPTVELGAVASLPCAFSGAEFVEFATEHLSRRLLRYVSIGDGEGYDFENVWTAIERDFASRDA